MPIFDPNEATDWATKQLADAETYMGSRRKAMDDLLYTAATPETKKAAVESYEAAERAFDQKFANWASAQGFYAEHGALAQARQVAGALWPAAQAPPNRVVETQAALAALNQQRLNGATVDPAAIESALADYHGAVREQAAEQADPHLLFIRRLVAEGRLTDWPEGRKPADVPVHDDEEEREAPPPPAD